MSLLRAGRNNSLKGELKISLTEHTGVEYPEPPPALRLNRVAPCFHWWCPSFDELLDDADFFLRLSSLSIAGDVVVRLSSPALSRWLEAQRFHRK